MSMGWIVLMWSAWIGCGVAAAGIGFAHAQRNWPSIRRYSFHSDVLCSFLVSLSGPVGLVACLLFTGRAKHGWLWPWSAKARREAGMED
jgi:hypothetical protein